MNYLQDLRAHWRPLLAATIGMSCGFTAMNLTTNIMGPHLIETFGWSKSDFALVGTLGAITIFTLPVVGRVVDTIGVRRTALIGVIAAPLLFLALSVFTGGFGVFIGLLLFQNILCMTTTSTVFTRTVVEHITRSRGFALALAASGPALTAAVGGPLLNNFVNAHGWRSGYIAVAIFAFVGGVSSLLMIPSESKKQTPRTPKVKAARQDYGVIFRTSAFWIILSGIVLSNLTQFITTSQLNIMLLENGVTHGQLSAMISAFAIGVLAGRFASGLALDRFPAPVVTSIAMALPAIGLFLIASSLDSPAVLMTAVVMLGLSYGAEGDVIGYLVARIFGVKVYSSVLGMMVAAISGGSTCGAILLSFTLKSTGGYEFFLTFAGVATLFGSLLFLLLPRHPLPFVEKRSEATA
jgi:MFS family permease